MIRRHIVISGINIYNGGALSVMRNVVGEFIASYPQFYFTVFCHNRKLFNDFLNENVDLIEIPISRKSWFIRLYFEYFWFYQWSIDQRVDFWFSVHDTTPFVVAKLQGVYCHNPSPFYRGPSSWRNDPQFEVMRRFYYLFYSLFIRRNCSVFIQQYWMRDALVKMCDIPKARTFVAKPHMFLENKSVDRSGSLDSRALKIAYPALPRRFKLIETALKAAAFLKDSVEMHVTVSGRENAYAKELYAEFADLKNVRFLGELDFKSMHALYREVDAIIFCSSLETWGLPLSEARAYNLPIFAPNLPYVLEVLAGYDKVCLYEVGDSDMLAGKLADFKSGRFVYSRIDAQFDGHLVGWADLTKHCVGFVNSLKCEIVI